MNEIESFICSSFPHLKDVAPIKMLGDGWGNTVVEANNGLIFRIPKNAYIQQQSKQQATVLPILAKQLRNINIPVPKLYIESSEKFPFGIMGYEKIPGKIINPEQINQGNMTAFASEVARMLLEFHTINISPKIEDTGIPHTDYSCKTIENTWKKASGWLRDNFPKDEYTMAYDFVKALSALYENSPYEEVVVQGDAWYGNILVDKDLHITGIVDFDKVSIGDLAIDFAVQEYVSQEFMNTVIRRYEQIGGNLGEYFDKRLKALKGIKALEDLNFCLYTNHMYPHIPKRVRVSLLVSL